MPTIDTSKFFRSYRKVELRYLVMDPNYDLTKLKAAVPPEDLQPMSRKEFVSNVRLLISHKAVSFTEQQFLNKIYDRKAMPACWCLDILQHMIGV